MTAPATPPGRTPGAGHGTGPGTGPGTERGAGHGTGPGQSHGRSRGRAKAVLLGVIGLHLVAETGLTPFLPQLFERLYGIEDPGATGLYIWICRIVGLAALPLWGLAARRWPLHRLVVAGLCGSAVLDLLLGMAPSYFWYTALSTAIVSTNSALLLAYPAFIAEHGDDSVAGERARLPGICSLVVIFHLSTVAATLVGAGVLALPEPRIGISSFAVLDLGLAWLTWRVLSAAHAHAQADSHADGDPAPDTAVDTDGAADRDGDTAPDGAAPAPGPGRRTWLLVLVQAALLGLVFDFSFNVGRPFFTEFAESLGSGSLGAGVLFFLPSVAALGVLPLARRFHDRLGDRLLPWSLAVSGVGLGWQALVDSLPALVGGRLLFGLGLGLAQVAVELRVFRATGTKGPAYTAVETARSAGLLAAPLIATMAVSRDLALPLAVAAVAQLLATVLSLRGMRRTGRPPAATGATPAPAAPPAVPPGAVPPPAGAPDAVPPSPGARPELALTSPAPPEENHR